MLGDPNHEFTGNRVVVEISGYCDSPGLECDLDYWSYTVKVAHPLDNGGDLKAVAPFVRIVAELDRYHGLGFKYQRRLAAPIPGEPAAPPLALTHAASASVTTDPAKVS